MGLPDGYRQLVSNLVDPDPVLSSPRVGKNPESQAMTYETISTLINPLHNTQGRGINPTFPGAFN
jgi:hypothetical protein